MRFVLHATKKNGTQIVSRLQATAIADWSELENTLMLKGGFHASCRGGRRLGSSGLAPPAIAVCLFIPFFTFALHAPSDRYMQYVRRLQHPLGAKSLPESTFRISTSYPTWPINGTSVIYASKLAPSGFMLRTRESTSFISNQMSTASPGGDEPAL